METKGKSKRGFASMSPELQKQIASKGGRAAHAKGTAHEFTPEEARVAGKKGGEAVSKNKSHMSKIGSAGGKAVSSDHEHMSRIGRMGGEARGRTSDDVEDARNDERGDESDGD